MVTTQTPLLLAVAALPVLASAGARDYAQLGQPCMQRYDASKHTYKDISSLWKRSDKCQPGLLSNSTGSSESRFALTCFVAPNDTGMDPRSGSMDLEGTCLKSSCVGISSNNVDTLEPSSERVTICHRTENEMNPWVRMTVDKSAWIDSGNDCGFTTEDYIVKEHGSRATVEDQMNKGFITDFTTTNEYWEYWDRACPYVRQNPDHPHRCCKGNDCCGDAAPEQGPEDPQLERRLQAGCLPSPTDTYSQDVYLTFMGSTASTGTLEEYLVEGGSTLLALENSFKDTYNTQGSYGQCVYYQRVIDNFSIDTSSVVPAINKNYDLVGFRVKATVEGHCNGCSNHLFFPTDSCQDVQATSCATCSTGEIVQISGKDLYPLINQALSLEGTGAEIYRIQGDVVGETVCSANQQTYLEATGEVVCL